MDWKRLLYLNSLVAAAYFLLAWLLLPLTMMPINAVPVWLPAGLGLAAVLIWGYRLLPAAFVGNFLVGCHRIYRTIERIGRKFCVG